MKIVSPTLSCYLAKNYFFNLLFMIGGLLAVIYLFDTVELLRRAGKYDDVPLSLVLKMGLLKLPEVGQVIFPFAILFSAIYSFWQLNRSYELIVVRSAGFSVWQFLSPVLGVAVLVGIFQITIINPVGSILLTKFERMESNYLSRQKNQIALFEEGIWLRQVTDQMGVDDGYIIIHADKIAMPGWKLKSVIGIFFDRNDNFIQRVDADNATLGDGFWQFNNVVVNKALENNQKIANYKLSTELTTKEIEESFSSPETMSFWKLPKFIKTLESTGFDATRLKIYFQSLLSQPLLFAAMIMLAASVALRPPGFRGTMAMVAMGIMIGFLVFFMSSFLQALGSSHQIPIILAAWSPALITFLLGIAVMLNSEDG